MDAPPDYWVLVPFYSNLDHLRQTLQSVVAQTDRRWRAIVVDDSPVDPGVGDVVDGTGRPADLDRTQPDQPWCRRIVQPVLRAGRCARRRTGDDPARRRPARARLHRGGQGSARRLAGRGVRRDERHGGRRRWRASAHRARHRQALVVAQARDRARSASEACSCCCAVSSSTALRSRTGWRR